MRPNIFKISGKELSQDAFLTWLLQWADPSHKSVAPELQACGEAFVKALLKKGEVECEVEKVVADRQWERIDVRVKVNDKYMVIIEDKVGGTRHSNQLKRYLEIADEWCKKNGYEKPIPIYLKTEEESITEVEEAEKRGFKYFSGRDLLESLSPFRDCKNDILKEYIAWLHNLYLQYDKFETANIKNWNWRYWVGFYRYLEDRDLIDNFHHVNNQSRPFWNGLVLWEKWGNNFLSLQIEQGDLCFKIGTHPDDTGIELDGAGRSRVRNKAIKELLSRAKTAGMDKVYRPPRLGNGHTMTLAYVACHDWMGPLKEPLNKKYAIQELKKYSDFLMQVLKEELPQA